MGRRWRKTLTIAAAAGVVLGGLVPPANAASESLEWGPCPAFGRGYDELPTKAFLECATVEVPLDYAEPDGETIEIAVSRLATADPSKRRGVLLLNPGGPGGPGLPMPLDLLALGMPASVSDTYDLIGFDPRGVGYSAPVDCGIDVTTYGSNVPPYARGPEDVAAWAEVTRTIAEECRAHATDGRLRHYSTANTARDMDRIRAALGEEKISYYGLSYGSALGAAYVSLFPERTDRIVLDSNVGDTVMDRTTFRRFGLGAEQRFSDFAAWAAKWHGTYELGRTARQVRATYFELAERLDREPYAGINGAAFRAQTFAALYDDGLFSQLAQFWQAIHRGIGAEVRRLSNALPKSAAVEGYDPANIVAAQLAIVCNDAEFPRSLKTYQRDVEVDRMRYPVFGAAAANITPCAFWPSPLEPRVEISTKGPANILLLQNLRDPATPYVGGMELRRALGQRARLVSIDQGGHGAYLLGDNACANNAATRYLVAGELPRHDTFCGSGGGWFGKLGKAEKDRRERALRALRDGLLF